MQQKSDNMVKNHILIAIIRYSYCTQLGLHFLGVLLVLRYESYKHATTVGEARDVMNF